MLQGESNIVVARVSPVPADIPALLDTMRPGSTVEDVRITAEMTAELMEVKTGTFTITRLSPSKQPVLSPFAEWRWRVVPLDYGSQELNLIVTALVRLPDRESTVHQLPVKTARIQVIARPGFIVREFFDKNWQWILGTSGISIVVWLFRRVLMRALNRLLRRKTVATDDKPMD